MKVKTLEPSSSNEMEEVEIATEWIPAMVDFVKPLIDKESSA